MLILLYYPAICNRIYVVQDESKEYKVSTDLNHTSDPFILYTDLKEDEYQGEANLLDRYISFSTEIVRLALLSIAVFGFMYKEDILAIKTGRCDLVGIIASTGILILAISIALSLWFRYRATDAFRHYVYGLRLHKQEEPDMKLISKQLAERNHKLKHCPKLKGVSALALGLGALFISIAYLLQLFGCR